MNPFDSTLFVLGILSFIISIVAIWISWRQSKNANSLALQANKTALEALDLARFEHSGNVIPKLSALIYESGKDFNMSLHNSGRGKAVITSIKFNKEKITIELFPERLSKIYPFELLYNNKECFRIQANLSDKQINRAIVDDGFNGRESEDVIRDAVLGLIRSASIEVLFKDRLGTGYVVILKYKSDYFTENSEFEGDPVELPIN